MSIITGTILLFSAVCLGSYWTGGSFIALRDLSEPPVHQIGIQNVNPQVSGWALYNDTPTSDQVYFDFLPGSMVDTMQGGFVRPNADLTPLCAAPVTQSKAPIVRL